MTAKVVKLADFEARRASAPAPTHREDGDLLLPLESRDFRGQMFFWPDSRLDEREFNRVLRYCGVQTVIDLRDEPLLGSTKSLHLARCAELDRWGIDLLRIGPFLRFAKNKSTLSFHVKEEFLKALSERRGILDKISKSQELGAVLIIHREDDDRLPIFLRACEFLGVENNKHLTVVSTQKRAK